MKTKSPAGELVKLNLNKVKKGFWYDAKLNKFVDKSNNMVSADHYTLNQAGVMFKSLKACKGCLDCYKCSYCVKCDISTNLEDCKQCVNCHESTKLASCESCKSCSGLKRETNKFNEHK